VGLTETTVEWVQSVFAGYEVVGLVLVSFTEAILSPIPPDPLLAVLAEPASLPWAVTLGLVTTIASVAGGAVGYLVGDRFSEWAHERFAGPKMDRVEGWYQEHGEWVVGVAALSPIPFKIFTVTSGLLNLRFWPFAAAATVGRGVRFLAVAILATFYGDRVIAWVDAYEIPLAIAAVLALIAVYWFTREDTTAGPEGTSRDLEEPG